MVENEKRWKYIKLTFIARSAQGKERKDKRPDKQIPGIAGNCGPGKNVQPR